MCLAQVEERVPGPLPAIRRSQNRLGAIEYLVDVDAVTLKRVREFLGMVGQGRPRRGTDQQVAVEGPDDNRLGAVAIGCEVAAFILQIAVVEVRPLPKYIDPEPCHIV